ncbi:MAG: aldo/keto reductase [Candidatus Hydrogenedentota bacterium]
MEFRQLGKSGIKVPAVCFGAWAIGGWMWGGTDDRDAINAIHAGIDNGITCIDTAPAYGMGHSEQVVGEAIQDKRDQVVIATKCGLRWDLDEGQPLMPTTAPDGKEVTIHRNLRPHSIRHECEESLRRLKVDEIDLYQCHWPDPTTPVDDTMEGLLALQQEGKIRAIGVSNFTPELMDQCLANGRIESDQPKYNALERDIEQDVLPYCREHGLSILAYSPIAQGLLTGKVTMDRTFPKDDVRHHSPLYQPENRRKVLAMLADVQPIADAHDATLAQVFIAWTIAQPGITAAIVGARNPQQAIENAQAGAIRLTNDQMKAIRDALEALGELR